MFIPFFQNFSISRAMYSSLNPDSSKKETLFIMLLLLMGSKISEKNWLLFLLNSIPNISVWILSIFFKLKSKFFQPLFLLSDSKKRFTYFSKLSYFLYREFFEEFFISILCQRFW